VTWRGGDQVIPRPTGARPGEPAPWAALAAERRRSITLDAVRAALERRVPPASVVPDIFLDGSAPGLGSTSAVLVALFDDDDGGDGNSHKGNSHKGNSHKGAEAAEARVLLTRRSKALRFHQGEVSFPGGKLEAGETPVQCALREAHEEVGLDPSSVEVVGELSTLLTFSSQTLVTPVVGFLSGRPDLYPSPSEVDRVFDVELSVLASEGVFREERWGGSNLPGTALRRLEAGGDGTFPVWFFELDGDTVWGATARVLVELLKTVLGV
jgi:8-oxo-dGTP pyrophosphatase MutT (NUDIX family)